MIQAGLDYANRWDAESFYRPVPQVKKFGVHIAKLIQKAK